jgi:predicted permease
MPDWKNEIEKRLADSRIDPAAQPGLIEELAQHSEDRYLDLLAGGLDEAEARQKALGELAHLDAVANAVSKEKQEPVFTASSTSGNAFADFRRDLRYGIRALWRAPLFAFFAIVMLGVGIGTNTTAFTIINTLLLHPLPVADTSNLVALYDTNSRTSGRSNARLPLSYANWKDYAAQQTAFNGFSVFTPPQLMTFRSKAGEERVFSEFVSAQYFSTLGLRPAKGRFFLPAEVSEPGSIAVAILSYNAWQSRFQGAPDIIGRSLDLNNVVFTVVGVAPKGFLGITAIFGPDVWLPATMYEQASSASTHHELTDRGKSLFHAVARLRSGIDMKQAEASLLPISAGLSREYSSTNENHSIQVRPINDELYSDVWGGNGIVIGTAILQLVVALILGIACSNVANLLLARAAARRQEFAVRVAIGAKRGRLIRQMLTESMLLSLLSCVLGLLLGLAGCRFVWSFVPAQVARNIIAPKLDTTVFVFALAVSLLTAFVFGLAPALQASKTDVVIALKEETRTGGRTRRSVSLTNVLLAGQVAFSLVCLFAATLFFRSIQRAYSLNPGFQTARLGVFMTDAEAAGYDETRTREFYRTIRARVSALPGITAASWASGPPFWNGPSHTLAIEGIEQRKQSQSLATVLITVDTGYFQTMDIPLEAGRVFSDHDGPDSLPVAIINERLAQEHWPGGNALGRRLQLSGEKTWRQVAGIARNANYNTLGEEPQPCVYLPLRQNFSPNMCLYIRTTPDPATLFGPVQNVIRNFDPKIQAGDSTGVTGPRTGAKLIEQTLWGPMVGVSLLGVFGFLALALASIGLYGVMVYSVTRRRTEIGLRMALGASRSAVLRLILRDGMTFVGTGVIFGLLVSLLLGRVLARVLFGISSADPLSFAAAIAVLLGVALIACYFPARSASRVDPMDALRDL